jgi:Fe-S cluster biosynthesis and repair protein YggX
MAAIVHCSRCGRDAEAPERVPIPGPLGAEIKANVCASCWAEWQASEVMVINELRLNFMDPASQKILDQQMRQFLLLPGGTADSPA